MVHLLSSERPSLAAAPSRPFAFLANWFAQVRARRTRRIAFQSLLDYDDARLEDLGISRHDLFEALDSPSQRPGLWLAHKRAASARKWLDP